VRGYLQRLALSAMKPGGSIQPILGSLFSPAIFESESGTLSEETVQRVTGPAPPPLALRTDPPPSLEETTAQELPLLVERNGTGALFGEARFEVGKAGIRKEGSANSIETPTPSSSRSPLVPGVKENPKTLVRSQLPAKSDDRPREEALKSTPVAATEGVPLGQRVESQSAKMAPAESEKSSVILPPNLPPVVACPGEKLETLIKPRFSMKTSEEHRAGVLNPGDEAAVEAAPRQNSEEQEKELAPRIAVVPPKVSTREIVNRLGAVEAPGKAIAKEDFRKVVQTTPASPKSSLDGKERMALRSARATRKESDEIQIHIGRIEVIAVPPAAPVPPAAKPKRGTPSLAEYLRRSNRGAV
jgi:hypothetical protein